MIRKKNSTNKKTKTTRKKKVVKQRDERIPKLIGLGLLAFSLYLLFTYVSYIFTWKYDYSVVDNMSWNLLFDTDREVQNLFGRLGAIIAHNSFQWFLGIGVFFMLPMIFATGRNLVLERPLKQLNKLFQYCFVTMFWLAIFAQFIFNESNFPWGGAIGKSINVWLSAFIGPAGMVVFFIATLFGLFIWLFNPNLNEFNKYKLISWIMAPQKVKKNEAVDQLEDTEIAKLDLDEIEFEGIDDDTTQPTEELDIADNPINELEQIKPIEHEQPKATENPTLEFNIDNALEEEETPSSPYEYTSPTTVDNTAEAETPLHTPQDEEEATPTVQDINISEGGEGADESFRLQEENAALEPYDPCKELSNYKYPSVTLLNEVERQEVIVSKEELIELGQKIVQTLADHKLAVSITNATIGPTVTLFEVVPAPGVRINKIKNLDQDIALSLKALGIRIIAPLPGKGTIGIEVPNVQRQMVSLREILESPEFKDTTKSLPIAIGRTTTNEIFVADLAKMPHLLVAGATGQGKSVGINSILISLLYKKHPSQLKLVLIDPKIVELSVYSNLAKHFLGFLDDDEVIITDVTKVINIVNSLCIEMDERYEILKNASCRNISEYNAKFTKRVLNPNNGHRFLPYIVLVIDEFADLIMTAGKEIDMPIARLAQKARAVGIHLIIATQRPTTNIITGTIKANFPARMAFKVSSAVDSKTILDQTGANSLVGKGDMLLHAEGKTQRIQCAFVDTPEVEEVIKHISEQQGFPQPFYLPEVEEDGDGNAKISLADCDALFKDCAYHVVMSQSGSTSMLQRKFEIGYNRAGRIMDQLESMNIVGPSRGSKAREVYFQTTEELDNFLAQF